MKKVLVFLFFCFARLFFAQVFSGEVYMRDNSDLYMNSIYVTNLRTGLTVLTAYDGGFRINANPGDVVRFTSIVTDRKDITLTPQILAQPHNLIELKIAYNDIQEVVLNTFKPTGNLKRDVSRLKDTGKKLEIEKRIGLPEPKGDGNPPQLPVVGYGGGSVNLSIDAIYDALSGEKMKKERLYKYLKLQQEVSAIRQFYGDDYFIKLKIPKNMIENFLEFICTSEDVSFWIKSNKFDAVQNLIEKYLPVYRKRLSISGLGNQ